MICAISPSSITEIMLNKQINSTANAFKFVLSPQYIEHIKNKFQNDPARLDLFNQWLLYRANFANRVRYIDENEVVKYFNITCDDDIYASCAYFAGHFIFDEKTVKCQAYIDYGIDVSSISNYQSFLGRGDNPLFEQTIYDGGLDSPLQLSKYFKGETNVVFIDNYINSKSIDFIKYVIMGLCHGAQVTVITKKASFDKSFNILHHNIKAVRNDLNINYFYLNNDKEFHDRHIYIGDRIYIRATSGLDAFSFHGLWCNREGTFSVYDIHECIPVKIFDVKDKFGNLTSMKVKKI